ncbi:MAG: hypothetical protein Q6370_014350 [Candidatus Sigynarchaeota archaeon]
MDAPELLKVTLTVPVAGSTNGSPCVMLAQVEIGDIGTTMIREAGNVPSAGPGGATLTPSGGSSSDMLLNALFTCRKPVSIVVRPAGSVIR